MTDSQIIDSLLRTPQFYLKLSTRFRNLFVNGLTKIRKGLAWLWISSEKERFAKAIQISPEISNDELVEYFVKYTSKISDVDIQKDKTLSENLEIRDLIEFQLKTNREAFTDDLAKNIPAYFIWTGKGQLNIDTDGGTLGLKQEYATINFPLSDGYCVIFSIFNQQPVKSAALKH